MKQLFTIAFGLLILTRISFAQSVNPDCQGFDATYTTKESRCASTGSITITPSGGSGNYSYKVLSPVSLPLTSTSSITGLAPGIYTIQVKDMNTGCTIIKDNITVAGSYSDPRFLLDKTDLICTGTADGTITATGLQNGRSPFSFKIVSPSFAQIGTVSTTGSFNSLPAGNFYIQLSDSCGGVQTRSVVIQGYNWSITGATVTKLNCEAVSISVSLSDDKGNSNQSGSAFNGFKYGVVNSPSDTTWYTMPVFTYSQTPLRRVTLVVKDRCGYVRSTSWENVVPSADANVTVSNAVCGTFDVKLTNMQNFASGVQAYLKRGTAIIQTNTTGEFTNIPYGSYCIELKDNCYDTSIIRCFTQTSPIPSVNATVDTFHTQCSTFDVKVGGQRNLFNPTYNLYNNANVLLQSNITGAFNNLPYGSYCMRIISANPCYDTTITRCFTVNRPKPSVASLVFSTPFCSSYTATITNTVNLFNATYCLYQNNVLVTCASNATFPNLSYDVPYCIKVKSSSPCYDTTISICFTRAKPAPGAASPSILNRTCTSFSAKIASVINISDPQYCLYDSANRALGCNMTGQFDNIPYGNNYYITVVSTSTSSDCNIAVVKKTFSASRNIPTVASAVTISNETCTTFFATLTSLYMTLPKFFLYNSNGTLIAASTEGKFSNLLYGTYKIVATTNCLDTFVRVFTATPPPPAFSLNATESCTIGATDVKVTFTSGQAPFIVKVLNPINAIVATQTITSSSTFVGLPALPSGLQYRVVAIPSCGKSDTIAVTPKTSLFSRTNSISLKCPNALAGNGSGDIDVELNSNIGLNAPIIVKQNGAIVSIYPSLETSVSVTNSKYKFKDLTPGTYILEYNVSSCTKKVYDTITLPPYTFPDLKNSAAYQCDNRNFSISAVASGGVSPFLYDIIGSAPSGPSILSTAQTNSVFNVLTGSTYSLVRMRAIDACGNGTLNDVSVLPLGQLTVRVNNVDCYSNNLTLSVDTVPNASYSWYLKKKANSTDSILVTTNQNYNIPYLLPTDTGTYVCKTVVNEGCLQRLSYFNLKGDCSIILPVKITSFTGKLSGNDAILNWSVAQEDGIKEYQVERSVSNAGFEYIGTVSATNNPSRNQYTFTDHNAPGGKIKYRLKIVEQNNGQSYSKIIELTHNAVFITAAPNPVKQELTISISAKTDAAYSIKLFNLSGQVIYQQTTNRVRSGIFRIQRNGKMPSGFYLVKVLNLESGEEFTEKLIFE